jgi:branched-subunit amino acid aminotransferase/4-amino-4-deoxychorismate lyase
MKSEDDDILFLSPDDTVLESSVANIFVVRHNRLFTAPLGPNVLDGVMRKKVIEVSREFFDDCIESASTIDQLYKADAVFGTNSIRGPFLVGRVDDHEIIYSNDFLNKFDEFRKRVFG